MSYGSCFILVLLIFWQKKKMLFNSHLKVASGSRFIMQEFLQPKFYRTWTTQLLIKHCSLQTSDQILSLLRTQARVVDRSSKYYPRECNYSFAYSGVRAMKSRRPELNYWAFQPVLNGRTEGICFSAHQAQLGRTHLCPHWPLQDKFSKMDLISQQC